MWLIGMLLWMGSAIAEPRIEVAEFSRSLMDGWRERVFLDRTEYRLVTADGTTVLRADSHASASGLYREVSVDLRQTPILNWSWKIDRVLEGNDERSRDGDDYPARVYVVFSGGLRFWRTRAINYVWSSQQAVGSEWPNAYTGNARMIAVSAGAKAAGRWHHLQRDVLADYRRLFGGEPGNVDAVAIMTDTDDTGQRVGAWYGDIWFSAR